MKRRSKKKIENRKKLWLIIPIVITLFIFYYLLTNTTNKTIKLNDIFNNLTEYDNSMYLNSLNQKQKDQLIASLNQSFYEECKNKDTCTVPYLSVYMDIMMNLGVHEDKILKDKESIVISFYSSLPHELTEQDLNGFEIQFLTNLCKVGVVNQTEKLSVGKRIINIERNNPFLAYKHISYFIKCLDAETIDELSNITSISLNELNNKLCNNLPAFQYINQNDSCQVLAYLRIKKFCGIEIMSDERSVENILLLNKYESYYQKNCKVELSSFNLNN